MNLVAVNFSSKDVCVLCDTGNSGTDSMQAQTVAQNAAQNVSTCLCGSVSQTYRTQHFWWACRLIEIDHRGTNIDIKVPQNDKTLF